MWSLYDNTENIVPPLLYTTRKGQDSVISEILEAFESYNIVFLHGAVGTGKSAIALSVANQIGGGIVVTPTKILQDQYVNDYCKGNYKILKPDKDWMKIAVIKGRGNFQCLYEKYKKCNHKSLPCIKTLSNKTLFKCHECNYVSNVFNICPKCNIEMDRTSKPSTRLEIAKECLYYSPIVRGTVEDIYMDTLDCLFESLEYDSISGNYYIMRRNEEICPYYEQYRNYKEADVIIMNSAIWMLETLALKRKPERNIEIIDEGDDFLDSLSLKKTITQRLLTKVLNDVENGIKKDNIDESELNVINGLISEFISVTNKNYEGEITEEHKIFLKDFVKFLDRIGDENAGNYADIMEFISNAYVSITKNNLEYFIPEPKIIVKKLLELSSKKVMFMSATFQSMRILEEIFGFDNFCFVVAETNFPGTVYAKRIGKENRVTYGAWKYKDFRIMYWKMLSEAIKKSTKPCMVAVHAYKYLPEGIREKLKGKSTLRTPDGNITFSTVMNRGVDLKDDKCRSIVMLKYPFPSIDDPILKAMKLKLGDKRFWMYYQDMAKRNFIQTIGRGVRHKDDWVELWSPDKSCFGFLDNLWNGKIIKRGQE